MASERRACSTRGLAAVALLCAAACGRISGLDDLYPTDAGAGATGADATSSSTSSGPASGGGGETVSAGTGASGATGATGGSGADGGAPAASYFDVVMADEPLAYWRLGEAMGLGTAVDESPNHLDGNYFGPLAMYQPGAIVGDPDHAVDFPQVCDQTAEKKGVDVGDESALEFVGKAPFTIEAWIRPTCTSTSGQRRIIEKAELGGTFPQGYQLYRQNDTGGLVFYRRGATNEDYVVGPANAPPLDQWSYVAVVFDGTKTRIFVNGTWGEADTSPVDIQPTSAKFRIGAASNDNFAFAGGIDEVAVYDTALDDLQIIAHWNTGKGLRQ